MACEALALLEVDEVGFDKMDRAILLTIIEKFNGGPVGVETIAAAIGEEKSTIEDVYEPYLIQEGYLQRTPRGRLATVQAYRHLGITRPDGGDAGPTVLREARMTELGKIFIVCWWAAGVSSGCCSCWVGKLPGLGGFRGTSSCNGITLPSISRLATGILLSVVFSLLFALLRR